jgi:MFS family permease
MGCVIGTFLLCLSVGYAVAGILSRSRFSEVILGSCLMAAGIWVCLTPAMQNPVCDWLWDVVIRPETTEVQSDHHAPAETGDPIEAPDKSVEQLLGEAEKEMQNEEELPEATGEIYGQMRRMKWAALLAALILFAFPIMMLALVSPTAVRWLTDDAKQSGLVTGMVLAFSTVASFAGCIVTAFYLVEFSIAKTLLYSGIILILIGVILITRWVAANAIRKRRNAE